MKNIPTGYIKSRPAVAGGGGVKMYGPARTPHVCPRKGVEATAEPHRTKMCHRLLGLDVGSKQAPHRFHSASIGLTQAIQRHLWRHLQPPYRYQHSLHMGILEGSTKASTGSLQVLNRFHMFSL